MVSERADFLCEEELYILQGQAGLICSLLLKDLNFIFICGSYEFFTIRLLYARSKPMQILYKMTLTDTLVRGQ